MLKFICLTLAFVFMGNTFGSSTKGEVVVIDKDIETPDGKLKFKNNINKVVEYFRLGKPVKLKSSMGNEVDICNINEEIKVSEDKNENRIYYIKTVGADLNNLLFFAISVNGSWLLSKNFSEEQRNEKQARFCNLLITILKESKIIELDEAIQIVTSVATKIEPEHGGNGFKAKLKEFTDKRMKRAIDAKADQDEKKKKEDVYQQELELIQKRNEEEVRRNIQLKQKEELRLREAAEQRYK